MVIADLGRNTGWLKIMPNRPFKNLLLSKTSPPGITNSSKCWKDFCHRWGWSPRISQAPISHHWWLMMMPEAWRGRGRHPFPLAIGPVFARHFPTYVKRKLYWKNKDMTKHWQALILPGKCGDVNTSRFRNSEQFKYRRNVGFKRKNKQTKNSLHKAEENHFEKKKMESLASQTTHEPVNVCVTWNFSINEINSYKIYIKKTKRQL